MKKSMAWPIVAVLSVAGVIWIAPAPAAAVGKAARAGGATRPLPSAPKELPPGEIEGRKPIAPDSRPPHVNPDALPGNRAVAFELLRADAIHRRNGSVRARPGNFQHEA